jgi:hypothetical protein
VATAASRHRFLKLALAGAGTVVGAVLQAGLPGSALGRPSPTQDAEILNYALLREECANGVLPRGPTDGPTPTGAFHVRSKLIHYRSPA